VVVSKVAGVVFRNALSDELDDLVSLSVTIATQRFATSYQKAWASLGLGGADLLIHSCVGDGAIICP
jgi:hypothetical protein